MDEIKQMRLGFLKFFKNSLLFILFCLKAHSVPFMYVPLPDIANPFPPPPPTMVPFSQGFVDYRLSSGGGPDPYSIYDWSPVTYPAGHFAIFVVIANTNTGTLSLTDEAGNTWNKAFPSDIRNSTLGQSIQVFYSRLTNSIIGGTIPPNPPPYAQKIFVVCSGCLSTMPGIAIVRYVYNGPVNFDKATHAVVTDSSDTLAIPDPMTNNESLIVGLYLNSINFPSGLGNSYSLNGLPTAISGLANASNRTLIYSPPPFSWIHSRAVVITGTTGKIVSQAVVSPAAANSGHRWRILMSFGR